MTTQTTRFLATKEEDGHVVVHGKSFDLPNNYATLCCLDIGLGGVTPDSAPVPKNAKINCEQCKNVWLAGQHFSDGDFNVR